MHIHNVPLPRCAKSMRWREGGHPMPRNRKTYQFLPRALNPRLSWKPWIAHSCEPLSIFCTFFSVLPFFSFASVCMSALTLAKMTLCRSATLQALGPSMAYASPFEGYVSLYHLHRTMATPHCITTNFCAKSLKRCLVQCVSFFFLHAKASKIFCCGSKAVKGDCARLFSISVQCFRPFMFSGYVRNAAGYLLIKRELP